MDSFKLVIAKCALVFFKDIFGVTKDDFTASSKEKINGCLLQNTYALQASKDGPNIHTP